MTYLPTSRIGRILATLWLSACFGVLLFGFIQRETHDMPVSFLLYMVFLTAPIGYPLVVLISNATLHLANVYGLSDHPFLYLLPMWIACVLVGYFQWFIALPWAFARKDNT